MNKPILFFAGILFALNSMGLVEPPNKPAKSAKPPKHKYAPSAKAVYGSNRFWLFIGRRARLACRQRTSIHDVALFHRYLFAHKINEDSILPQSQYGSRL